VRNLLFRCVVISRSLTVTHVAGMTMRTDPTPTSPLTPPGGSSWAPGKEDPGTPCVEWTDPVTDDQPAEQADGCSQLGPATPTTRSPPRSWSKFISRLRSELCACDVTRGVTTTTLAQALGLPDGRSSSARVGRALRALGWLPRRPRVANGAKRVRRYFPTSPLHAASSQCAEQTTAPQALSTHTWVQT
jgi:hypothetical protein